MDKKIEKRIIEEYKKGKGSTIISREIGISKPTILNILNKNGIVRKRDRCSSLDIRKNNNTFYVIRNCPKCNKEIKTESKDRAIACRNHFNKINKNSSCKSCSLLLQVGEGNPFYGKKHTKKSKNQISKGRKGKLCGDKNHMKQEKYREMSKSIMRSNWDNGILNKDKMSEQMKQNQRSGKIKSVITSKKEKEIIDYLKKIGYKSVHSFRIDSKICDIYIPSLNLVIEYFGDYWHCNPSKYSSNYYNQKKKKYAWELWEYDNKKLELIKSYGYNLEIVWEKELKYNNKLIENIISKYDTNFKPTPERS